MDTTESSAPHTHPSTEHHDDTVEAHYACLERPHACMDGWVFLGRVVESEHDLDGEVVEYERVPCHRYADSPDPKRGDRERVDAQAAYALTHLRGEP
jgi:hypothetical protein